MNVWLLLIFGLAAILAIGAVLVLVLFKPKKKGLSQAEFDRYWQQIVRLSSSSSDFEVRQSVIEADKLLDRILKSRVKGNDLGGRLKMSEKLFGNKSVYHDLWEAHKLRNKLAHEVDFYPSAEICQSAIKKFGNGFRSMGYILK